MLESGMGYTVVLEVYRGFGSRRLRGRGFVFF